MPPAARLSDMHLCPMVMQAGPVSIPHVGGPLIGPCVSSVLIGKLPAAVVGDMLVCAIPMDSVAQGSSSVMIGGRPAARMGDPTVHGGSIASGYPTVLIGG
jgi:uncharacterized Zn-binding protein involved in type VI secretion